MPSSNAISAEQAAHAIVLLSCKHDTASGYLHSMDGDGMSRAEFKEYLRTSSQEEYLELLNGHIADECATLVKKAAQMQEKRVAKGQPLLGRQPAKETAEQFFDILGLKKSQGLRFKDVCKSMKAINFPDPLPVTPSSKDRKITTVVQPAAAESKTSQSHIKSKDEEKTKPSAIFDTVEHQDLATNGTEKEKTNTAALAKTKAEKELSKASKGEQRREAFELREAEKAQKAAARKAKKNARKSKAASKAQSSEGVETASAAGTTGTGEITKQQKEIVLPEKSHSLATGTPQASKVSAQSSSPTVDQKSKKRKRDSSSPPSQVPSAVPIGESESASAKSKRKRQRSKAKSKREEASAAPALENGKANHTSGVESKAKARVEQKDAVRTAKKQKTAHNADDKIAASDEIAARPRASSDVPPQELDDHSLTAQERKERRNRRKREARKLKQQMAASKTAISTQEGDAENAFPEKQSPEETLPEKTSPEKASPKKASPKKASPKKASPKKVSPEKVTLEKASPEKAINSTREEDEDMLSPELAMNVTQDEDEEMTSPESVNERSIPIPTQETAEFVSAVEPENPFNNQPVPTEPFRIGRTLLPALEAKQWTSESSPLYRSPQTKAPITVQDQDEDSVAHEDDPPMNDRQSDASSVVEPLSTEQESRDVKASITQETAKSNSSDESSEDESGSDIDDDEDSAIAPSETVLAPPQSILAASHTSSPIARSSSPASLPPQPTAPEVERGASVQKAVNRSSRSSISSKFMPIASPALASLGSLRPMQPKTTSIPSHGGTTDPKAAFRNLNKFLNGGNSSEESDESSSDSSSEDESTPKPKPATSFKQKVISTPSVPTAVVAEPKVSTNDALLDSQVGTHHKAHVPAVPAEQSDIASAQEDIAVNASQVKNKPSPNNLLSFGSFHEELPVPTQQSPSPEIPDFPTLMDQGGYIPHFSDTDYNSSHVQSEHPTSEAGNTHAEPMELDLLSPFKDRNLTQGSVEEGIVKPSEIVELSSSPPSRSASASVVPTEMGSDRVQHGLSQEQSEILPPSPLPDETRDGSESHSHVKAPESPFGDVEAMELDQQSDVDVEDEDDDEDQKSGSSSPISIDSDYRTDDDQAMAASQLLSQDVEVSKLDQQGGAHAGDDKDQVSASSPISINTGNRTDDDQVMASSQLLGEASVEPPSRHSRETEQSMHLGRGSSPQVVIHHSPKSEHATVQPVLDTVNDDDDDVMDIDQQGDGDDEENEENGAENANENEDDNENENASAPASSNSDSESGDEDHPASSDEVEGPGNEPDIVNTANGSNASTSAAQFPSPLKEDTDKNMDESNEATQPQAPDSAERLKRKSTGTTSRHFSMSPERKPVKRVAGQSSVPFPKLSAPRFGLIQETMWQNPFHLLCAVLFLNKTSGQVAKEIILEVLERWPTPAELSEADPNEILPMVEKLGLQNERTKKLIRIAKMFVDDPPQKGRRHRTLHYPKSNDGKHLPDGTKSSPNQILEEDSDEIAGFLEIGHLYGAGPYAWDSWRIFCRDVLRGVADGYNGEGVEGYNPQAPSTQCTFEPEWKRVVPNDKELRACLRWMWLREGWDWDPLTGKKKPASVHKLRDASQGIAEWNEPVPFNPHGIDMETTVEGVETDEPQGPDSLVAGVKAEDVVETTEKPHQGVQDGTAIEAPPVARTRITRSSQRSVPPTGPPAAQSAPQLGSIPELANPPKPAAAPPARRRRVVRDAETPRASATTTTKTQTASTPSSAGKVSPRSIRKIKAKLAAEYKASQPQPLASTTATTAKTAKTSTSSIVPPITMSQPNPTTNKSPRGDSPAKNTRQRVARIAESGGVGSPAPPPARQRRTVKDVKAVKAVKASQEGTGTTVSSGTTGTTGTTGRLLRTRMQGSFAGKEDK